MKKMLVLCAVAAAAFALPAMASAPPAKAFAGPTPAVLVVDGLKDGTKVSTDVVRGLARMNHMKKLAIPNGDGITALNDIPTQGLVDTGKALGAEKLKGDGIGAGRIPTQGIGGGTSNIIGNQFGTSTARTVVALGRYDKYPDPTDT